MLRARKAGFVARNRRWLLKKESNTMSLPPPEILWLLGATVFFLFFYILYAPKKRLGFHACPSLMTKGEQPFYRVLKAATAARYDVCPKVRVADVISCDHLTWKNGGWRVATWHLDFVLIDPYSGSIKLCIELDDKSHLLAVRQRRDVFLNDAMRRASVRLLRLPYRRYTRDELKAIVMRETEGG